MSDINLPPFYVGQKVVGIVPNNQNMPIDGEIYTVLGIRKSCCEWEIDVGLSPISNVNIECGSCGRKEKHSGVMWFRCCRFSPVQENFQSITLEKCIETETPLISVN